MDMVASLKRLYSQPGPQCLRTLVDSSASKKITVHDAR